MIWATSCSAIEINSELCIWFVRDKNYSAAGFSGAGAGGTEAPAGALPASTGGNPPLLGICFFIQGGEYTGEPVWEGEKGVTIPSGDPTQSFILEIILTAILMVTILSVSHGAKEKGITAALAIGAVVGLEAMFAGPICGASMNPARSLGPALVSWNFDHILLYPIATTLGAIIAIPLYRLSHNSETNS